MLINRILEGISQGEAFIAFYTCSLISITDGCCNSLIISSNGQVGALLPVLIGSYVYHQTASDGRKIFLGPQNTFIFSYEASSGNKFWLVSSFDIKKISSNNCGKIDAQIAIL